MADGTGTTTPEKPINFTAAETLHYGGEVKGIRLTAEQQRAKNVGAGLRAEKAKTTPDNAKNFLESYKNRSSENKFTKQNREDLSLKFGAGEAKKDPSTGKIEIPAAGTPEAKVHCDEAQAEIESINGFIQYSEITAEARETGKTIAEVMSRRSTAKLEVPANYDAQREKALDYIINTEVIQEGLPDLAKIANPEVKRKLIEQTLAADPALRTKVLEKMAKIREEAKTLPELPVNKEVSGAKESKTEAETRKTENLDLVRDRVGELLTDKTKADPLRVEVERLVREGKSVDQVVAYLRMTALGQLKNTAFIEQYDNAKTVLGVLEQRLSTTDKVTHPDSVERINKQIAQAEEIINNFEAAAKGTDLGKEYDTYSSINFSLVSTNKDGAFQSDIANGIDQIIKAQKDIVTADKVIKEKGGLDTKAQEAWKADRLEKESNLISKMKDAVQESIAEVLDARYDDMTLLERQRMKGVAEEEGKKGKKAIENGIKSVEDVKEHRWIEYNPLTRKKEVHRYMLGSDIKYAAYAGEDGIKRLILRDSNLLSPPGLIGPVQDWKTVDLSSLPEETKKTLEGVYAEATTSYKQKLFGDFFLGKNALDRTIFGRSSRDLALRNAEYEALQTKFGEVFTQGINSKAEVKAAMETIKASGTKMSGGLLAILALLIGAPIMGAKKAITG